MVLRAQARSLVLVTLVPLVALAASCQKMPLVAPSGTSMTLVASTNTLPVNGAADITAVLIEGAFSGGDDGASTSGTGTPVHNGTVVTFLTTLGRIEPGEAKTHAGRATVRLIADGRSGIATVTAFSGAATQTVEVNVGAASATRIAVTANPQQLPGNGGTSVISARVEDQQGNGIQGVPVSFTATRGTLSNTSPVLSNGQGIATTSLTTNFDSTVTATAGGSVAALTGTVEVTLSPRPTIGITAPTGAMVAVPVSFTFTPGAGAVVTGVDINWGDGSSDKLGAITGATAVQHMFRTQGVATVIARVTDTSGATGEASVPVIVAPLTVSITFAPTTANVGQNVTFTAVTPAGAQIGTYFWDFIGETPLTTAQRVANRSFATPGTKFVTVRVTPLEGGTSATSDPVAVIVVP
jgi:hypothetical protein